MTDLKPITEEDAFLLEESDRERVYHCVVCRARQGDTGHFDKTHYGWRQRCVRKERKRRRLHCSRSQGNRTSRRSRIEHERKETVEPDSRGATGTEGARGTQVSTGGSTIAGVARLAAQAAGAGTPVEGDAVAAVDT